MVQQSEKATSSRVEQPKRRRPDEDRPTAAPGGLIQKLLGANFGGWVGYGRCVFRSLSLFLNIFELPTPWTDVPRLGEASHPGHDDDLMGVISLNTTAADQHWDVLDQAAEKKSSFAHVSRD